MRQFLAGLINLGAAAIWGWMILSMRGLWCLAASLASTH